MDHESESTEPGVVSVRTMDIVVAVLLLVLSGIVIQDSLRIGVGWAENEGPESGYFPFYIGVILAAASLVTLARAILAGRRKDSAAAAEAEESFVSAHGLRQVLLVLVPVIVYVGLIQFIGIYVSSAIFIALFMMYFGRYRVHTAVGLAVVIALVMFVTFEMWFLVPLPKGPIEYMLGF